VDTERLVAPESVEEPFETLLLEASTTVTVRVLVSILVAEPCMIVKILNEWRLSPGSISLKAISTEHELIRDKGSRCADVPI
jgi:hypothetical protein